MKKFLALFLALLLCLTATAALANEKVKLAASPVPHAAVLEFVIPLMAEKGYDLEVYTFNDYVLPNLTVESGEMDGNYFQHTLYMNTFNKENNTHIAAVIPVHFEPMAVYQGKSTLPAHSFEQNRVIGIPNDSANEGRALQLLADLGLIELDIHMYPLFTLLDITANPYNIEFVEVEAAQLPRMIYDFDYAVINGNYAIEAGLSIVENAIGSEEPVGRAYDQRVNYVCVKEGNEEAPWVIALWECLNDQATRDFVLETYKGAVFLAPELDPEYDCGC